MTYKHTVRGITVGETYFGRRVVEIDEHGLNVYGAPDVIIYYYYEGENEEATPPMKCSIGTFKKATGI